MQFKPPEDVDLNHLSPSDEEAVHKALHKLAESVRAWLQCVHVLPINLSLSLCTLQVRVRHLPLFPPFEDYDKVHRGNVTTGQVSNAILMQIKVA